MPAKIKRIVDGEVFVGREDIIEKIKGNKKSFFIIGARRVGKTSLLRFLEQDIPGFYISVEGITASEKIKRKLRNCFTRRKLDIEPGLYEIDSFFEFMEQLDVWLEEKEKTVTLLFDEVEQIAVIEEKEPGFIAKFKNIVESSNNIRFVLAVSPHFKKTTVVALGWSAFMEAFQIETLTVLTREQSIELIQALIPKVTEKEIENILNFTHYQPYLITTFISKLSYNRKLKEIGEAAAKDAYNLGDLDGIFPNYFDGLEIKHQQLIKDMHSKKFKYNSRYEPQLSILALYGYLKSEDGQYKISNWFFNHWLDCNNCESTGLQDKRPTIFICHAHEDKEKAKYLYKRLKAEGLEPWLDRENLRGGDYWNKEIKFVLNSIEYCLIINSKDLKSKIRGYVNTEINTALEIQKEFQEGYRFIIPITIDGELLQEIRHLHTIDLSKDCEQDYQKLIENIKTDWQKRNN